MSYCQLVDQAEHIAAALRSLGLKRHDRVGIYSLNNYQWVLTQLAASLGDLILVNINPAY
jgi:fatty-acyl-CoA synthase